MNNSKTPNSNANFKQQKINIFDVPVDIMTMDDAVNWVLNRAQGERKVVAHFVNADCLNKAYCNKSYRHILQRVQRVFADGSGVSLAGKLKHKSIIDNVNGTDMFPLLCKGAQKTGVKIFLLGAGGDIAKQVKINIQRRYPAANIVGTQDGYFDVKETKNVILKINESKADILLVAMGAPLQEQWIDQYRQVIDAKVCIGVGGLFDFYSGRISRSPLWLRKLGCEWIWRLIQEPKRMWKRYLVGNFVFVARVFIELSINVVIKMTGGDYAKR